MALYDSHKPKGIRTDWEKSRIVPSQARDLLGFMSDDEACTDACAWFDQDDALKVLVADSSQGTRYTLRMLARGRASLSMAKISVEAA